MKREQAEQKAFELYPPDTVSYGIADNDDNDLVLDINAAPRKAYLQCWDDLNEQQEQKVDYQKMFANCKLPNEQLQSSNIDMSDWHSCKVYGYREGIDKCSGCDQDKVREAAEKVLKTYRNSPTEEPIIEALQELEKALNQNK